MAGLVRPLPQSVDRAVNVTTNGGGGFARATARGMVKVRSPNPVGPALYRVFSYLLFSCCFVFKVFSQAVAFSSRNTTYAYTAPLGASYGPIENCHTCQLPCICALSR